MEDKWTNVTYRKPAGAAPASRVNSFQSRSSSSRVNSYESTYERSVREEREREEAARKKQEQESQLNDFNFPSLTSSFGTSTAHSMPSRSFASLAKDWKTMAEEQKKLDEQREFEQEFKRQQKTLFAPPPRTASSFGAYRSSAEDTYEEQEEPTHEDEGWTTVTTRKVQVKPKSKIAPRQTVEEGSAWDEQTEWNADLVDYD